MRTGTVVATFVKDGKVIVCDFEPYIMSRVAAVSHVYQIETLHRLDVEIGGIYEISDVLIGEHFPKAVLADKMVRAGENGAAMFHYAFIYSCPGDDGDEEKEDVPAPKAYAGDDRNKWTR